jgi:DNA modification methylase
MARAKAPAPPSLSSTELQALMDRGTVERLPLSSVIPWDENPREHDEQQLEMLVKSIRAHGFCAPLVVQSSSMKLVAGHGRRLALLRIAAGNDILVPIVKADLTDAQAVAYAVADNRIAELSTWNIPLLRSACTLLDDGAFDFESIGYSPEAMNELFATPAPGSGILPGRDPEDAPPLPAVASSRLGDLYHLGRHRLLCGDSTSADDVARLMDGERADCLLTDPPYGVAYKSDSKSLKAGGKASIKNDDLDPAVLETFLTQAFMCAHAALSPHAGCYVFYPSRYHREFENALNAAKMEVRAQIIWAKTQASFGFAQYKWKHEPILFAAKDGKTPLIFVPAHEAAFYCFKSGQSVAWEGDRSQTTVWTCSRETGYVHPTQKPVELLHRPIKNSTKPRGIVLDLFAGSGSTLMACEVLGRSCYTIELDPKFVDVVVKRWEDATGKQATLVRLK